MVTPAPFAMDPSTPTEITLRSRIDALRAAGRPLDVAHAVGILVPLAVELADQHRQGYQFFVYPGALYEGQDGNFHASQQSAQAPTDPRDLACLAPESRQAPGAFLPGQGRASVYAIGAMLYELITLEAVGSGMRRPSEVIPGVPAELEMILSKALVSDPGHRPDDLNALAQALYQINASIAAAPPPADVGHLDHDTGFDVDVSLSLLPPAPSGGGRPQHIQGMALDAPLPPGLSPNSGGGDLLAVKARLEGDPRPRYVVVKDGMDHGPFSAVELLQQVASHTFEENDLVRDSVTGSTFAIRESADFAPFARHARMGRHEKAERAALHAAVAQESRSTTGKAVFGFVALGALLLGGGIWFMTARGARSDRIKVVEEHAANVESDVGLKVKKRGGGGGVIGKSGGFPMLGGGMSCESAQNAYVEEMKMGSPQGQADLTAGQFQAVLGNGSYLASCGVPDSTSVRVCAAIQNGRAVGVTISTSPSSGSLNACIAGKVRGMSFPSHPKLDVTRTTF